jgi:hypothetical protein
MCRSLLEMKAPGLHFYTLNQLSPTREILTAIGFPAVSLPLLPLPVSVSPSPSPKEGIGNSALYHVFIVEVSTIGS